MNPSILVRHQEGQPLSVDINTGFIFYDVFSTGVSYRSGDSFISFIDLKIVRTFTSDTLTIGRSPTLIGIQTAPMSLC